MADPRAIVQVALDRKNGLSADVVVNTWHFEGDPEGTQDRERWDTLAPGLVSRMSTFYAALNMFWSKSLAGTGTIKIYDASDPPGSKALGTVRQPRVTETFTFAPGSGNSMPAEVACCLSMKANVESGANPRRRRGRVFLGPFNIDVTMNAQPAGAGDVRPSPEFRQTVLNAAETMALGGVETFRLAIYSPRTEATGGTAEGAWNDVVELYMDDAWDTVRSRGSRPSSRLSLTL